MQPRDIGTAKAPFSSSQVIPADARLNFPYSAVGKIWFEDAADGKPYICSGAVIDRGSQILTAGHCVHKGSGGAAGYHKKLMFVPAYYKEKHFLAPGIIRGSSRHHRGQTQTSSSPIQPISESLRWRRVVNHKTQAIGDVVGWLGYRLYALIQITQRSSAIQGNLTTAK